MKPITRGLSICIYSCRIFFNRLSSVVDTLRLADRTIFPIPVTLDVSHEDIKLLSITPGARIALRDPRDDEALAIITGPINPDFSSIYLPTHVLTATS
jgi:ATP sulfurylase